ncbi:MAG TPA: response regulator [Alphaproteobacteria bacterium]
MTTRGSKILLVDDYPANVLVTSLYLEDFGYACDIAVNGAEALSKAITGDYAAILMDVELPDINGLDVTRMIRSHQGRHYQQPSLIIGMTAHAMVEDRNRCLAAGMDDYISKPFNPDLLREKLHDGITSRITSIAA